MNSEQPLLLLRMDSVIDLLGDQGGVAAGAVVDNQVNLDLVLHGLVHDFSGILDHLRVQHAADHFVKREGFGIGFLIAHPTPPSAWQTVSAAAGAKSSGKRPILPHAFSRPQRPDPPSMPPFGVQ